ncbi:NgoFVII family restriction endonuclease, partial [Bacillus thuringiensis]
DLLLKQEKVDKDEYIKQLEESNCLTDDETITSVQRIFELEFFSQNSQKKYGEKPILSLQDDKMYMFNDSIRKSLEQNQYFKRMVMDIIKSARKKSKNYECDSNLTVYKKYSRKD